VRQLPQDQAWALTAPTLLAAQVQQARLARDTARVEALQSDPLAPKYLAPAVEHLALARQACPLAADVELSLAELRVLLAESGPDAAHIGQAMKLAPADPAIRFRCGLLDVHAGRLERGAENWRRCLELQPAFVSRIVPLAMRQFTMEEIVCQVLPASPSLLLNLADEAFAGESQAYHRRLLVERAEKLLAEQQPAPEDAIYLLGLASELKGDDAGAVAHYQDAVQARPEVLAWRFRLARAYQRQGLIDKAHEQARWCVRMDPSYRPGLDLLKELYEGQLRQ
jgi:tetratricopeptide (TPR) repeat protein